MSTHPTSYRVRPATTRDIPGIMSLMQPFVERRILLGKERVVFYEAVQEFVVAEDSAGTLVGAGALHVMWEDLGEIRTLAVDESLRGAGVGHLIMSALEERAVALGLSRLFCLTFETAFFTRHGYSAIEESIVDADVYAELVRSPDEGVAEFLDLARVKPNTLGNTRMLKHLA
ncbi:amino-acid N-acetyltransferase [Mycetocola saprophilus]|uniref:amino-acid N-acetyltransferase n=1 Tax=Mycetocola saprophilus TaxID=76636 RepID=UPI0004BF8803|nr:amino-acid N-acetyltransferase [Mycetocola saprophilus]